ncbi:MAG: glycoside hydrolase family 57 protein [Elusimicrobiota bacterium]
MSDPQGYLCLVLHAHLPYVRHPEYPDFLEEDWLSEAITETYVPLLDMMERMAGERTHFRLTMSLTPPLCNMLADDLLMGRYKKKLEKLLDLAEKEVHRTRSLPSSFHETALMYQSKFRKAAEMFDACGGRLLTRFRALQDAGYLEIITCGATHGYLPLMIHPQARRAQIQVAVQDYRRHFGRPPRGIWLPECAYATGVDEILAEHGIRFSFLDAHGLLFARPRPRYGVFAPVFAPAGVAFFGRDTETAQQVWSAESGYPGDPSYREFYRDIGYDLDYTYIRNFLHEDGVRRNVGIKYHRVTGRVSLTDKAPYSPAQARETAASHAGNFLFNRERQVEYLRSIMGRPPVISSIYDAELYGHWWFEGPDFLEFLLKKIHYDQSVFKTITPPEYLEKFPEQQIVSPEPSSWGDKGYHEVWLNASNDWIYPHLHVGAERMIGLADEFPNAEGLLKRALNQAARELLLAQSSDWAFLMTVGTARQYSELRTREHVGRLLELYHQIRENRLREDFVRSLEERDNIFPEIDYRVYQTARAAAAV